MSTQVSELSVEEVKEIVAETIRDVLEDWLEDLETSLSRSYEVLGLYRFIDMVMGLPEELEEEYHEEILR